MGVVIPMKISTQEVGVLAEDYLRSYRPHKTNDDKEKRTYRAAADLFHSKLNTMGLKKINEASPKQLRAIYRWLIDNMRPGFDRTAADVLEIDGFGKRRRRADIPEVLV